MFQRRRIVRRKKEEMENKNKKKTKSRKRWQEEALKDPKREKRAFELS